MAWVNQYTEPMNILKRKNHPQKVVRVTDRSSVPVTRGRRRKTQSGGIEFTN